MTQTTSTQSIPVGRLLRSGIRGCAVGCHLTQQNAPSFGEMLKIPLQEYTIYGLIYDIHVDDDGLVRQLVSTEGISDEVIEDNRRNRNVPLEMSVLFVGYEQAGKVYHLLPPRPPLTLDVIENCPAADLARFTSANNLAYLRLLFSDPSLPGAELLAAHMRSASAAHAADPAWTEDAVKVIIALLKDDYAQLLSALNALSAAAE